ncbi:ferritin-like domain-containing protein [Streptomyces sp. 184]|uniref:ferritin-like domain-containing protein n=1 Tax=Streptomyces sp. 184 TaxID=1827526 RepID=UPI00389173A4
MAFDIPGYINTAGRVQVDDLDLDAFAERPLSEEALRCLRYMSDVESHTICYLRDVLVTPSHRDPDVTAFMSMWAFEEFWHGEAIDSVLRAHGQKADYDHIREVREAQGLKDRLAPIYQSIAANAIGEDFVAVHMTWGAINEWSAHAAYGSLIEKEQHPELTKLLGRIQRQESRHLAFYASQAKERLERSQRARSVARWVTERFWQPVGSTIQPVEETRFVLRHLLGDDEGAAAVRKIDEKVHKLPGMAGLNLVQRGVADFGAGVPVADLGTGRRGSRKRGLVAGAAVVAGAAGIAAVRRRSAGSHA